MLDRLCKIALAVINWSELGIAEQPDSMVFLLKTINIPMVVLSTLSITKRKIFGKIMRKYILIECVVNHYRNFNLFKVEFPHW
jgi:hypothetical protein